jgi:hypothetical protein
MSLLILNGSPSGEKGNTQSIIDHIKNRADGFKLSCTVIHLEEFNQRWINNFSETLEMVKSLYQTHDAVIFTTGTYWDSWGSPLQYFLEKTTALEAHSCLLGKPCSVVVSMHAVGGKEILSRLQGVLNTQGFLIPPMSGFVYSLTQKISSESSSPFHDDFWTLEDVEFLFHNLLVSIEDNKTRKATFKAWPVDHKDPSRIWIK